MLTYISVSYAALDVWLKESVSVVPLIVAYKSPNVSTALYEIHQLNIW